MRIPPGELSPSTAHQLTELLTQLEHMLKGRWSTDHTIDFGMRSGVPVLRANIPERCTARITGKLSQLEDRIGSGEDGDSADSATDYESCRYSWVESAIDKDSCTPTDVPGGRKGFTDSYPAVEISGRDDVQEGTIVELFKAPDGESWRFTPGGSGGGGLELEVVTCVSLLSADIPTDSAA